MKLSPKQHDVLIRCRDKRHRITIFDGSVRSGKTVLANYLWTYLTRRVSFGQALMAGVTLETLRNNALKKLREMMPGAVRWQNEGKRIWIGNKELRGCGAGKSDSADIIQGDTIKLIYLDEMTKLHPDFIRMCLSRMSEDGAMLIGTTNPDNPFHYLKKELIDRRDELDLGYYQFRLEDNVFLGSDYLTNIRAEYAGSPLYHKRYIEGEWVQAEGVIYDSFDPGRQVADCPKQFPNVIACVDYGTHNPTVFLLIGWDTPDKLYVFKEYYHDSTKSRQKTDDDYVRDFGQFVAGHKLLATYLDPSAASLSLSLRRAGFAIRAANNEVLPGIQTVSILLPKITIDRSCTNLLSEWTNYVWDENAASRGEDKPLKQNDHSPDALRYGLHSHFPGGIVRSRPKVV